MSYVHILMSINYRLQVTQVECRWYMNPNSRSTEIDGPAVGMMKNNIVDTLSQHSHSEILLLLVYFRGRFVREKFSKSKMSLKSAVQMAHSDTRSSWRLRYDAAVWLLHRRYDPAYAQYNRYQSDKFSRSTCQH